GSPLPAVQPVLESLRDDFARGPLRGDPEIEPAQRRELIQVALRQSNRMMRLTADLLDVERVEARGTLRLERTLVPVRAAVVNAVSYLNTTEVKIEVVPDLTVEADPQRLEQILVNLVANALRHGAPPVVVRGYVESGTAR